MLTPYLSTFIFLTCWLALPPPPSHLQQSFPYWQDGGKGPPPQTRNLLSPPTWKIHLPTKGQFSPLKNNFYAITPKNVIFSCSQCSCTIFNLTLHSLYTQIMLILILIGVQYLQNFVFNFEKGSHGQNHSLVSLHPSKKISAKFPIPLLNGGNFPHIT